MTDERHSTFRDASSDRSAASHVPDTPQTRSPSYTLAFADEEFITRDALRPASMAARLV